MQNPKFTKFKDVNYQYRFNLKAVNGEIILKSEAYTTSANCDNGITSVRINAPYDIRYARLTAVNNQYYFNLLAANGLVIGTSETYTSAYNRDLGIETVKRIAPTAPVEDIS